MFKKAERLQVAEFDTYFKTGRRHHTPHATFIIAPADEKKVSVVVGKKVSKKAVKRNLLRRRVYAQLRQELPETFHGACIVLIKPSFATLPRKTAQAYITSVVAELGKTLKNT